MGILDYFKEADDYGKYYVDQQTKNAPSTTYLSPEDEARAIATLKVAPAAVARLPTAVLEAVQGIDQLTSALGERSGSIGENIARGRYRKGGYDEVQGILQQKQAEWQAANPDATPEQVKEFVKRYQNTPEYLEEDRKRIPKAFAINEQVGDAIDNFMGAPTDNVKTNGESLLQAGVQALIPNGINQIKAISKAGKVAKTALDFIAPGTGNITTAGKLAAGGAAAGVTGAIQQVAGRDVAADEYTEQHPVLPAVKFPELNIADGTDPVKVNAADKAEQMSAFSSIVPAMPSLAMFATIGAALYGIKPKNVVNAAEAGAENIPPIKPNESGAVFPSKPGVVAPTATDEAKKLGDTTYGAVNQWVDERAPVQRAIAKATGDYAEGVDASNKVGIHSPSAAGTSKRNHVEYGFLGDQQVTPVARMDNMKTALQDNGAWEDTSRYLLARSELSNRGRYIDEVQSQIQQKYIEKAAADQTGNVPKANDILADITRLQDQLAERIGKRFQLQQYSTDELKDILRKGPDVEGDNLKIGTRYVQAFDENNNAWIKQFEKDGLIEPEQIAAINRVHKGSYAPMIEDELKGAKGIGRLFAKATRQVENIDDPQARMQQRVNPFASREIKEGADGSDFLMDPHNAFARRSNQYHNWREQQLYVRDVVERIMAGKNKDAIIDEVLTAPNGNRTAFSDAEAAMLATKQDLSGYTPVKLRENNGKTTFIKFNDPLLTRALEAGPMSTSLFGSVKHLLQRGATGTWNLGFAPMSTMLENAGIQMLRPKGTVGFVDNAVYRAGKALGVEIGDGPLNAIGIATKPADLLIGQADALLRTADLFWKQNRIRMADNMLAGLETGSGWFGGMMQIPAFKAYAAKWAQNTVDTFHDTLEGSLVDGKGMTLNVLAKNLEHTRELEKFMDVHVPHIARLLGSAAAEPFAQMKMAISSYRDAAKWSHYNRQYSYQALKYGGEDKIPDKVIKDMQNEVRTLTGDFSKRMGNSKLQSFDDAIPYFRVMVQSTKNSFQRIMSDPKVALSVMTGMVMPKVTFEYEMANWDKEAYDWYYRNTSAYDRAGFIGFVRPDIMYRRKVLGEEIPFSPDHVYKLYSPQELRPVTESIAQAIRGLGAYKAGQKDRVADTSMGSQIGEALAAAFSPSMPPPLAGLLAASGIKIDPGNLFKGEPLVSTGQQNRINESLTTDTNITNGMHNTLGALFGNIGKSLMQGYATGEQMYKKTGRIDDAIFGGVKEAAERVSTPRAMPIPFMGDANNRRYRSTPVTAELYRNREAFSVIQGSRTGGKAFTPEDPLLAGITDELRKSAKQFEPKDFTARYKELDTAIKAIENNRSVPYTQRQIIQRDKLKELHQLSIEQQKWMLSEEKNIARMEVQPGLTIGQMYEKQFQQPFTLQNFAKRVKELKQKATK